MMNFETFAALWREDTFLRGAFNDYQDIDAFLDDPTCGVGNPAYDRYQKELLDLEFPTEVPKLPASLLQKRIEQNKSYSSYEDITEMEYFSQFFKK